MRSAEGNTNIARKSRLEVDSAERESVSRGSFLADWNGSLLSAAPVASRHNKLLNLLQVRDGGSERCGGEVDRANKMQK